ncbi:MAG: hypothetical protein COA37_19920 [Hoeflea sp.]|uniref:DUF3833 family protein n=1 Tax=Hoeflea sp. TaxID=1940281 RepID=UPI000C0FA283|nr:DUF3833 family protein [Hoeflea sp.]PHR18476.1 MAG: hypothetical protein COA37_19920 [Hoeflea sp.]|tara:strand:+ start:114069 stop:114596 length:528 start_codon:yes stop_codon:yes gene_type:complete
MTLLRPLAFTLFATLVSVPAHSTDLRLEDFFEGKTYAYGSFGAITGLSRSFRVDLTGKVRGKVLTLREDFRYDDGERDTKTWIFTRTGPNTYSGTREDVVGETTVRLSGNTARFTYRVDLNPGGDPNIVRFHDKLVLKDDGTLRNTALVTKFALPIARVRVNFAPTLEGAKAIKP